MRTVADRRSVATLAILSAAACLAWLFFANKNEQESIFLDDRSHSESYRPSATQRHNCRPAYSVIRYLNIMAVLEPNHSSVAWHCQKSMQHRRVGLVVQPASSGDADAAARLAVLGLMGDTIHFERANVVFFRWPSAAAAKDERPQRGDKRCGRIDLQSHQTPDRDFLEHAHNICSQITTANPSLPSGGDERRAAPAHVSSVRHTAQQFYFSLLANENNFPSSIRNLNITILSSRPDLPSSVSAVYVFYALSALAGRSVEVLAEVWGYLLAMYPAPPPVCDNDGNILLKQHYQVGLVVPMFGAAGFHFMEEYATMLMEAFPFIFYIRVPLYDVMIINRQGYRMNHGPDYYFITPQFGVSQCQEVARWQWYSSRSIYLSSSSSSSSKPSTFNFSSMLLQGSSRRTSTMTSGAGRCVALIKHDAKVQHSTNRFFNLSATFRSKLASLGVDMFAEDASKRCKMDLVNSASVLIDSSGATMMVNRLLLGGTAKLRLWITFIHPTAEDAFSSKCPDQLPGLSSRETFFLFHELDDAMMRGASGSVKKQSSGHEHYYYCGTSNRLDTVPDEVEGLVKGIGCD